MPRGTAYEVGVFGEQLACDFLINKGYSILKRNYRVRGGEIDIIAQNGSDLVFIEVKLRRSSRYGYPEEAVSFLKRSKILKTIRSYLCITHTRYSYIRFDIIALEKKENAIIIRHIKNIELA